MFSQTLLGSGLGPEPSRYKKIHSLKPDKPHETNLGLLAHEIYYQEHKRRRVYLL